MNVRELIEKLGEYDPEMAVHMAPGSPEWGPPGEVTRLGLVTKPPGMDLPGRPARAPETVVELG